MRIHICGVRGSIPAPGASFSEVGGNTSCVAIAHDDDAFPVLILDAGTGLRNVDRLMKGSPFRGTILLGHLHWDHTYGLPFFRAADHETAWTNLLLPHQSTPAAELIDRFMSPPTFPVDVAGLHGEWRVESIEEGVHEVEGFEVLAREIPHKGGRTFGYRISDGVSSMAYMSDHGPRGMLGEGPDGWGPYHGAALELCAGVDVMFHDAQHTAAELPDRYRFGHSAVEYAVELGRRSGARRVMLYHHDPDRTDPQVAAIEAMYADQRDPVVQAAREGVTLAAAGSSIDIV